MRLVWLLGFLAGMLAMLGIAIMLGDEEDE